MYDIIILEKRMSMKSCYIHIPFCKSICTYCDFCKLYYNHDWVDKYLLALEEEIKLNYKGEQLSTIYIGGGTPTSLDEEQLERLFTLIDKLNKSNDLEYTIETNVEMLNEKKIKLFKKYGVNRVSIGLESVLEKNIKFLGRHHTKELVLECIDSLKRNGIDNINVDLIYALKDQTLSDLKEDLDFIINLDVKHISTYSLMIEPNTKLGIQKIEPIDEEVDYKMYNYICESLKNAGFIHYEISNFAKEGFESRHNLTYWNNEEYYGFGLGVSGYIDEVRYDNTRSLNSYLSGSYRLNEEKILFNTKIENAFILGFRKIKGINKLFFQNKYGLNINDIDIVKKLLDEKKLIDDGENIFIAPDYVYVSNSILVDFIGGSYYG